MPKFIKCGIDYVNLDTVISFRKAYSDIYYVDTLPNHYGAYGISEKELKKVLKCFGIKKKK